MRLPQFSLQTCVRRWCYVWKPTVQRRRQAECASVGLIAVATPDYADVYSFLAGSNRTLDEADTCQPVTNTAISHRAQNEGLLAAPCQPADCTSKQGTP